MAFSNFYALATLVNSQHWKVEEKMSLIENVNPKLYKKCSTRLIQPDEESDDTVDAFDSREVFGILLLYDNINFVVKLFYQNDRLG